MSSERPVRKPPAARVSGAGLRLVPGDFDRLYRAHAAHIGSVALRLLGRRDEADDVVQEVFVAALDQPGRLAEVQSTEAWLTTIAVRLALRKLRRRRLLGLLGLNRAPDYEEVIDPAAPPEARVLLKRVYQALDALPAGLRLAWSLRHLAGESLEAVALHCGCSLATAKRRIAGAAQALEEVLGDGR